MTISQSYPSDIADDEWEFAAPYLTLLPEDAGQRRYEPPRSASCVVSRAAKASPALRFSVLRVLQSTPESGEHAGYDGAKRRKGSKVHVAVDKDTMGLPHFPLTERISWRAAMKG